MNLKQHTFPKSEHLCGEIRINNLFANGKGFIVYPLRIVYLLSDKADEVPVSVMVSVPKKRFKRAVKRNRLKRLMREAYRLNKTELVDAMQVRGLQMQVAFGYVSDEIVDFDQVERKMRQAIQKIIDKLPTRVD